MAGFIDAAVQDIDNRLEELREEETRLQAARAALVGGSAPQAARAARRPAREAAAASPTRTRRRAGRPRGGKGGNTRAAQALQLVRDRPGITIPEIAAAMKIEPNYLYRVMPKLTSDGLITRSGQGWHPAAAEAA